MDTSRHMQDHDLTLLPQSKIQFHLGYSRNTQDGPALSTVQLCTNADLYSCAGDNQFPVFENVRREQDEYRLGADIDLAGFKFTLMHSWVFFKDDSGYQENGLTAGRQSVKRIDSDSVSALRAVSRRQPILAGQPQQER